MRVRCLVLCEQRGLLLYLLHQVAQRPAYAHSTGQQFKVGDRDREHARCDLYGPFAHRPGCEQHNRRSNLRHPAAKGANAVDWQSFISTSTHPVGSDLRKERKMALPVVRHTALHQQRPIGAHAYDRSLALPPDRHQPAIA